MASHNDTGKLGETLAGTWFEARGYLILHRNWRHRHREIDIIAENDNTLHFIEVKTATTTKFGHPEEKADAKKIRFLIDSAEEYLYLNPWKGKVQFDVLAITMLKGEGPEYFLIEDIYE